MKLNHPGIYRIIGENYELLANIVGEVPCLRITSALLMNDLVQRGKFTILSEDSIEIQNVCNNPDAFLFFEHEYSEVCPLPPYRQSIRGTKMPDISNDMMKVFTERYISDMSINGRGIEATKAYILSVTDWSLAQINVLLLRIANSVRRNGRKQYYCLYLSE